MISAYIFLLIHFCFTLLFHCAPTPSSTSHPLTHPLIHTHTCIRILNQTTKQLNKLNNAFEKIRKNKQIGQMFL